MTSRVIPVAPFVLVVFGATGDLARRKLLPALFHRDVAGQLPEDATVLGVSRGPLEEPAYIELARRAILNHVPAAQRPAADVERFIGRLRYVAADADTDGGWDGLVAALGPYGARVNVF